MYFVSPHWCISVQQSSVSLFWDGEQIGETVRVPYLAAGLSPIAGYLGPSPKQQLGGDVSWKLGPVLFTEEVLAPAHVDTMFWVGPAYTSSYKTNLLRNQTYDLLTHKFLKSHRTDTVSVL